MRIEKEWKFMEVCPSTLLNSDASENVAYNNPDFPAYIKKDSYQAILIFVQSATGMTTWNLC